MDFIFCNMQVKTDDKKVRDKNFTAQEIISLAELVRQYRKKLYGKAGHCSDRVSCLV